MLTHFIDGFWFTLGGAFAPIVANVVMEWAHGRAIVPEGPEGEGEPEDFGPKPEDPIN